MELDIDQLSNDALGKIYDLIVKTVAKVRNKLAKDAAKEREEARPQAASHSAADSQSAKALNKTKKHKPMGKAEQERNIEKLREIKAQFQRTGSGSQEPLPSVEGGGQQPTRENDDSEEESEVDSEED